ncbi:unnamed protein product [Peronospora belbahrii]|uniref:Uncharacterized protein n=1 Tax=Peronospora belbahrii TaxID=622444 RepID=A0ABN8CQ55_9STRA|nr:unnamed protein product [Peronospora belbahrii]
MIDLMEENRSGRLHFAQTVAIPSAEYFLGLICSPPYGRQAVPKLNPFLHIFHKMKINYLAHGSAHSIQFNYERLVPVILMICLEYLIQLGTSTTLNKERDDLTSASSYLFVSQNQIHSKTRFLSETRGAIHSFMRLTVFLAFLVVTLVVNCSSFVSAERNANDDNFAELNKVNALREERGPETAAAEAAAEAAAVLRNGEVTFKAENLAVTQAVTRINEVAEEEKKAKNTIMNAINAESQSNSKFSQQKGTPIAENAATVDKDVATAGDRSKAGPIVKGHEDTNPQTSHSIASTQNEPKAEIPHATHKESNAETPQAVTSAHNEPGDTHLGKNPKETTTAKDLLDIPIEDQKLLNKFMIDLNLIKKADRGELDKLLVKTLKSASSFVTKNMMIAIAAGVLGIATVYTLFQHVK